MTARNKTNRTPKSSRARNRRLARKQATKLNFEALEPRQLLAALTVGNATDVSNAPDTSSITALMANDGGDGISLREAIAAANNTSGEDTITFASSLMGETITLGGSQLVINDSVTIQGLGADQLTISGNDASRIFFFGSVDAATYTIADITLTDGEVARGDEPSPQTGGAITLNNPGDTLIIERSVISESAANGGGAISIGNGAELQISDSALINNEANFSGSAILTGGNVEVEIVNSTISGNTSGNNRGALTVQTAGTESGVMTLRNVTVANNTGNGLVAFTGASGTSTITIGNSILADNGNVNFFQDGSGASFNSLGHNLFDDESLPSTMAGDQVNTDPRLEPLTNNGGPTPTHGLGLSSLAVNMGSNALAVDANGNALVNDQRGDGFARILFDTVDVGAFESSVEPFMELPSLLVTTNLDADDPTDSLTSLREAIDFANMTPGEDTITFDPLVFTGGSDSLIRLTQGELVVEDGLGIDGTSVGGVLITGDADDDDITVGDTNITDVSASFGGTAGDDDDLLDDNSRVVNFTGSSGNLTLTGLTITGGRAPGSFDVGGGILFDSRDVLSLSSSTVSGNSSGGNGGGIFTRAGDVSLSSSTVSGNSSGGNGGGISTSNGDVSLSSSTVSDNSSVGGTYGGGGGISTDSGNVSLSSSMVSGNSSGGDGGGISTSNGDVSLSSSTVSDNSSVSNYYGGGGIYTDRGDVSLLNSTVSGNSAASRGGGIYIYEVAGLSLVNSTVSGNSSVGDGGGIHIYGDVSLLNSTISGNSSGAIGGGGVVFPEYNSVTINNSIIAGNTDNGTAPDVLAVDDVANNLFVRNSLIGNATGSGITAATGAGNILNQAALLGSLADNGGPTLTHRLLPGSPAIDAGNNALAVDRGGNALTNDQRGEARIAFGTVDIGAYELQSTTIGPRVISTVRDEGGVLARPDLLSTFVVTFDQDVDVDAGDLSIRNDTLGSLADTSDIDFTYVVSNNTFTATWDFSSLVLDAAFYTFELSDSITGIVGGLGLDGNNDSTVGGTYVEEVYVAIPGDANLDGRVNVLGDAFILIGNLGTTTNLAFADGNFNGDGLVDVLGDAFILINNLGTDVRPPMLAQLRSNISQLSSASSAGASSVVLPVQPVSISLPARVLADADAQESLAATDSTSPPPTSTRPQLVLAGDQKLRDDVFGSEF